MVFRYVLIFYTRSTESLRVIVLQFRTGRVVVRFKNEDHTFEFPYRSPLEWLTNIITDRSLAPEISWYPVQKYLCKGGRAICMYDEPVTGKMWWEVQV